MNVTTVIALLVLALALSVAGGAIAGMRLAGKDLGHGLAAMMGGFYGPTAVVPAALLGLVVLAVLK